MFRNEEKFQAHQQAIEEKSAALALPNDDLQTRDNLTQTIQHKNVALQAQRDVYQSHLLRFQDQIVTLLSIVMFLVQMIQVKITLL